MRVRSQLADIKKVEADFKVSMKQLDVDLVKIAASDRDSARRRHASVKDMTPNSPRRLERSLRFLAMLGQ
jgi:hypothetical protein